MKKCILLLLGCFLTLTGHAAPLPASEVFQVNAQQIDANTFSLDFKIKPEYFLYADRIHVTKQAQSNVYIGPLRLPLASENTDKKGKKYPVYRHAVSIPVALLGNAPGKTFLTISYQGCSDDGFCYAPEEKLVQVTIAEDMALSQVSMDKPNNENAAASSSAQNKHISRIFNNHNWFMILLIFYGFGLLLSFTPCILPMIPVLSGIIIGHGKEISTSKAFFLSLSYVLSMSVTYAFAGAVVALLGANLQISMQSPWSIGFFSLIFVLLALSMFGFYEFKLPDSWQAKIGNTSRSQRGGHYIGAAVMGCLSTLILSPCVTAPLIGVLTYIAQTKNVLLGCLTLFVLSLGMGTPLLLIGTSAGKWLPETGAWMNTVKAFFGVLFIAVAIHLLSRVAPPLITMILWASLLIFSGIYCGALTYSVSYREKFSQSVGLILLGYGFLVLVGASMGATNPLQPLTTPVANAAILKEQPDQTLGKIKEIITAARGTPVMLDFYADWCNSCKYMEATTFIDPRIKNALKNFVVVKIDVTKNNARDKSILNYFNVIAPPTFIFFDDTGTYLDELKLVGEYSADEFLTTLNQVKS